jgi:F-type H+-transporting ATPase subunit epsilon
VADEHTLSVEVLTPEGEVFSGDVKQVSTRTAVGEIGILANHVPILAALEPTELRLHVSDSETETYAQAHGWLQVFANHALLLVEEAIPPDELDTARLEEQMKDAEQRLSEAEEGSAARDRAEKDKRRVEAFLELAGRGS